MLSPSTVEVVEVWLLIGVLFSMNNVKLENDLYNKYEGGSRTAYTSLIGNQDKIYTLPPEEPISSGHAGTVCVLVPLVSESMQPDCISKNGLYSSCQWLYR